MNMLLKSSANRKGIRLFHIWTNFDLFCCEWLWLMGICSCSKKGKFWRSVHALHVLHTWMGLGMYQCPCANSHLSLLQFWLMQNTSPISSIMLSSYVIIALKNVTLVSNKKSILVEMFDFAVTQVDNFCKNELITVIVKLLLEKMQVFFFSNRNDNRICLFKCLSLSL